MDKTYGSSSDDILSTPIPGGRALRTAERQSLDLSASIAGWGSDLDPQTRPGVPRDKAPQIGPDDLYPNIPQQKPPFRIHLSTEHARLTPVFGTSCPPRGLSTKIRNAAFKLSEGRKAHWLLLILADRIDMLEQIAIDLMHAKLPNPVKETGILTEFRFNRDGIKKRLVGGSLVVAVLGLAWWGLRENAAARAP